MNYTMDKFETNYFTKIPFDATSLGDLFKKAREKRGMALKDIAKKTRIHIGILNKLENNNLSNLPSKTYVKGFVRTIAQTLHVDPKVSLELLEEAYDYLIFENIDLISLPPRQEEVKKSLPNFDKNAVRKLFALSLLVVITAYGAINLTYSIVNKRHLPKAPTHLITPNNGTPMLLEADKVITTSLDFPKRLEARNAEGELIPNYQF